MAKAIKVHWEKVFSKKPIDEGLLTNSLKSIREVRAKQYEENEPGKDSGNPLPHFRAKRQPLPQDPDRWKTRRKDIAKDLRLAGNPSPGHDRIPFAAWRSLKGFGITILFDIANAIKQDNCHCEDMKESHEGAGGNGECDYNISTLVCLPKAATGEDVDLGEFFKPADTRHLS